MDKNDAIMLMMCYDQHKQDHARRVERDFEEAYDEQRRHSRRH